MLTCYAYGAQAYSHYVLVLGTLCHFKFLVPRTQLHEVQVGGKHTYFLIHLAMHHNQRRITFTFCRSTFMNCIRRLLSICSTCLQEKQNYSDCLHIHKKGSHDSDIQPNMSNWRQLRKFDPQKFPSFTQVNQTNCMHSIEGTEHKILFFSDHHTDI